MTLVSRNERQIVVYDIAFARGRDRIQKLVDNSPTASQYYSDAYSVYSQILVNRLLLKNKSQTYAVEGVDSDLRH